MTESNQKLANEAREAYIKDEMESKAAAENYVFTNEPARLAFPLEVAINSTDPDARERSLWILLGGLVKDIDYFRNEYRRAEGREWDQSSRIRSLEQEVQRLTAKLEERVHTDHRKFHFGAIACIKALRLKIPGIGLREAKNLLDFLREQTNSPVSVNWSDFRIAWNSRIPEHPGSPAALQIEE